VVAEYSYTQRVRRDPVPPPQTRPDPADDVKFLDAASEVLSEDEIRRVWDRVAEDDPDVAVGR
jgi:hypothetical protein